MKRQLIGQLQRPSGPPERVTLIADNPDPLTYHVRHLNVSSSSNTLTLDLAEANSFSCTLTENITTIDVNGPMATDEYWEFELKLVQDSTPRTVTWAAKYRFPGGTDPVMSTASGAVDRVFCRSIDGGTTWDCDFSQAYA